MEMLEQIGRPRDIFVESRLNRIKSMLGRLDVFESAPEIVEAIAELYDIDLSRRVDDNFLLQLRREFLEQEMKEVTSQSPDFIADIITSQIFRRIATCAKGKSYYDILLSVASLYQQIMPQFAPLLMKFMQHVMRECEESEKGIKKIFVLARDGNILFVLGEIVGKQLGYSGRLELVELNRGILGIEDEFIVGPRYRDDGRLKFEELPEVIRHSPSYDYLVSLRLNSHAALVDVGVYGTIIYILRVLGWKPWVFFLVSKNPFIKGYIDTVNRVEDFGSRKEIPLNLGGILADVAEAIPKAWGTAKLSTEGTLKLSSEPISPFYGATGMLTYWSAVTYAKHRDVSTIDTPSEIKNLAKLWKKCGFPDSLPFLMEKQTPKWSQAQWFIKLWERKNIGYVEPYMGPDPT